MPLKLERGLFILMLCDEIGIMLVGYVRCLSGSKRKVNSGLLFLSFQYFLYFNLLALIDKAER